MTWIRERICVCQQKMKTPAILRTGHGKSTTVNVCGGFIKEKCGWRKSIKKCLSLIIQIVARIPDFAAVSRTHARTICTYSHCWYDKYQNLVCWVIFFFFIKASYPTQCCPAKALAWMTQIRTRIRACQRIMKTPARLLTGHGKSSKVNVCGIFLKEKRGWGKS